MATCLICLAPTDDNAPSVIKCMRDHPMHMACLLDMIQHMGRRTCPYCSSAIPFAVPATKPRRHWTIRVEHFLCAIILGLTYAFSQRQRDLWHINRQLRRAREVRTDPLLYEAVWEFRRMVFRSALGLAPSVLLVARLVFYGFQPCGRRELWEVLGCLSLLMH